MYREEDRPIVYLDESGFSKGVYRPYGYSLKGTRCYGEHNWQEKGRTNAIGALLGKELLSISLWECSIDADIFYTWLKSDLLHKLPKKSVLVLDNASFHKRKDIKILIEKHQHTLLFLPTYSPDLNPIEHTWAHLKSIRKKLLCDVDTLFKIFHENLY